MQSRGNGTLFSHAEKNKQKIADDVIHTLQTAYLHEISRPVRKVRKEFKAFAITFHVTGPSIGTFLRLERLTSGRYNGNRLLNNVTEESHRKLR